MACRNCNCEHCARGREKVRRYAERYGMGEQRMSAMGLRRNTAPPWGDWWKAVDRAAANGAVLADMVRTPEDQEQLYRDLEEGP